MNAHIEFVIDEAISVRDAVRLDQADYVLGAVEAELALSEAERSSEEQQVRIRADIYRANKAGRDASSIAGITIPVVFWLTYYHYREGPAVRELIARAISENISLFIRVLARHQGSRLQWGLEIGPLDKKLH